jgi:hypothetical protein
VSPIPAYRIIPPFGGGSAGFRLSAVSTPGEGAYRLRFADETGRVVDCEIFRDPGVEGGFRGTEAFEQVLGRRFLVHTEIPMLVRTLRGIGLHGLRVLGIEALDEQTYRLSLAGPDAEPRRFDLSAPRTFGRGQDAVLPPDLLAHVASAVPGDALGEVVEGLLRSVAFFHRQHSTLTALDLG